MSGETYLTVIGRLTGDPELRFTPSGQAVVNFTVASNARKFDKVANEWKDEQATFWRCSAWRDMAENVAESLHKGMGVVVYGVVKSRTFETKEGEKRTSLDLEVMNLGPDLRWGSARFQKAARDRTPGGADPWQTGQYPPGNQPGDPDPWATGQSTAPARSNGGGGWQGNGYDEPPF